MSLLIAYEDHYCRELDRTIRRAVKRAGSLSVPREFVPVDGVTKFSGFVEMKWPLFRDRGFPTGGKPKQKALLCIADADVASEQLGLASRAKPYDEWIVEAEAQFTELLRARSDQPKRIHGALLRWNLESTLVAAFDEPEAMTCLAGSISLDRARLEEFLTECQPDPRTVASEEFVNVFDTPQTCMLQLARHLGWRKLKKGDRRKDEALEWITHHRIDKLLDRVPDIDRIAQRVRVIALSL